MCGRYVLRKIDAQRFRLAFPEFPFEEFTERPRFNIAPSQAIPVVRAGDGGTPAVAEVRWGLIPGWQKAMPKVRPINARGETVATSGMFRQAFAKRRCVIPADGFYEWRKLDAKTKQPVFIRFPDDRTFGFAGIWDRWREEPGDDPLDTAAIITTTPNAEMADIHDRMPVILRPEDYAAWLDADTPPAEAAALIRPYPDGELVTSEVSRTVNNPRNDGPECLEPA